MVFNTGLIAGISCPPSSSAILLSVLPSSPRGLSRMMRSLSLEPVAKTSQSKGDPSALQGYVWYVVSHSNSTNLQPRAHKK